MITNHTTIKSIDQEYKLVYNYVIKEWRNNHNRKPAALESDWLLFKECGIGYDLTLDLEARRPIKILWIRNDLLAFILLCSNYE